LYYLPQKGYSVKAQRCWRCARWLGGWASAFDCAHGFFPFKIQSAEASCLFVKSQSPDHNPVVRQDFAKKNTTRAQRGVEIFFQQTPLWGLVLTRLMDCSEILAQKG